MPRPPKTFTAHMRELQCEGRRATIALLERWAREVAHDVDKQLPEGVGFCLIMFNTGAGGDGEMSTYVSNAEREGMILHLEEMLGHLKNGRVRPPAGAGPDGPDGRVR